MVVQSIQFVLISDILILEVVESVFRSLESVGETVKLIGSVKTVKDLSVAIEAVLEVIKSILVEVMMSKVVMLPVDFESTMDLAISSMAMVNYSKTISVNTTKVVMTSTKVVSTSSMKPQLLKIRM